MNERMQFTLMPSVVSGFRAAECTFWISQYEAAFGSGLLTGRSRGVIAYDSSRATSAVGKWDRFVPVEDARGDDASRGR